MSICSGQIYVYSHDSHECLCVWERDRIDEGGDGCQVEVDGDAEVVKHVEHTTILHTVMTHSVGISTGYVGGHHRTYKQTGFMLQIAEPHLSSHVYAVHTSSPSYSAKINVYL